MQRNYNNFYIQYNIHTLKQSWHFKIIQNITFILSHSWDSGDPGQDSTCGTEAEKETLHYFQASVTQRCSQLPSVTYTLPYHKYTIPIGDTDLQKQSVKHFTAKYREPNVIQNLKVLHYYYIWNVQQREKKGLKFEIFTVWWLWRMLSFGIWWCVVW